MALRDWVKLPSAWIENGGLKKFAWNSSGDQNANYIAGLMLLAAIAHRADDETGSAELTYGCLCKATGLSRAKVSGGLRVLEANNIISREGKRSAFHLVEYEAMAGWAKLPAKRLYTSGRIAAFDDFKLRNMTELHALKCYFLFAARRDNSTNRTNLSFDKITEYSGIERNRIRAATSFLAALGLVYTEHIPSGIHSAGVSNAYRLAHLDSYNHPGTRGRSDSDAIGEIVL